METNQLFSSNSSEMRGFIFNRLQQTDNQKTLYTLRLISKSEQERVVKKIQTAKLNFCNIEKFATSKFSARIKFLEVSFRVWLTNPYSFQSFNYLSNTYLPYAQNIKAKVYPSFETNEEYSYPFLRLEMREPLTFRRLHIVNYSSKLYSIWIIGKYNVQIRNCEFIGVGVQCDLNANVYVTESKFIKVAHGLKIGECDSLYVDEISLDECIYNGLIVVQAKEVINIVNVRVISCGGYGIDLSQNTSNFKLSNTIIKDCETGIKVLRSRGEIQKTKIEGCRRYGIQLEFGAIVHYAALEFKHNSQDVMIRDNPQFLQLENIQ